MGEILGKLDARCLVRYEVEWGLSPAQCHHDQHNGENGHEYYAGDRGADDDAGL